jgi:hypothetical protein
VKRSALDIAATVTVVTGSNAEEVLRAFGADPERPESPRAALDGLDFDDYRNKTAKGLVAVQRFTGRGITARDRTRSRRPAAGP